MGLPREITRLPKDPPGENHQGEIAVRPVAALSAHVRRLSQAPWHQANGAAKDTREARFTARQAARQVARRLEKSRELLSELVGRREPERASDVKPPAVPATADAPVVGDLASVVEEPADPRPSTQEASDDNGVHVAAQLNRISAHDDNLSEKFDSMVRESLEGNGPRDAETLAEIEEAKPSLRTLRLLTNLRVKLLVRTKLAQMVNEGFLRFRSPARPSRGSFFSGSWLGQVAGAYDVSQLDAPLQNYVHASDPGSSGSMLSLLA
jgi:hypothetical protein